MATQYRVATNSAIVSALISAARNGKEVTVLELRSKLANEVTEELFNTYKELYDMHVVLTGHFHDSAYASLGTTKLFRIGTAAGPNEYSDKLMIASGGPEQSLFIVTKEQRVAAHIIIDLTGVGNYNEEGSVHV